MRRREKYAGYATSGGFRLKPFTEEELDHIHRATMEVLEHTGVFVAHDEALDYFDKAGAKINSKTKVVRIPPFLVKDALDSCPPSVIMHARDPKQDTVLEGTRVSFTNFGEALNIYDIKARHILATHKPLPIPEEARLAIRKMVTDEEAKRGLPISIK